MDGPRELLRRAANNRRRASAAPEAGVLAAAEPVAPPRMAMHEGHATYTALMRSHDRLRTRHLPVQDGETRA